MKSSSKTRTNNPSVLHDHIVDRTCRLADAMLRTYAMDQARSDEIKLEKWLHRPWRERFKEYFFHIIGRAL